MSEIIHLEVIGGLCNRLMALISGVCISEDLHRNIIIYWRSNNRQCTASFYDLFQKNCIPNWVKIIDENCSIEKVICISQIEVLETILNKKAILSRADFHKTDPKRWNSYLKKLLPIPHILYKVRKNFLALPRFCVPVGVHIRRTDNTISIAESPLSAFELAMSRLPNGFFYVASDDNEVVQQLMKVFSNRIYCHETLRKRDCIEGIEEAVVSLYTLAFCSQILGSYGSTFSRIAAKIGSKECHIIRKT
jgi:hypothetical protein